MDIDSAPFHIAFVEYVILHEFDLIQVKQAASSGANGPLLKCAAQSLIISLGQHYGVAWALALQPITAAAISPLAQVLGQGAWQAWVIAVSSTGMLMLLGTLTLSSNLWRQEPDADEQAEAKVPINPEEDAKINACRVDVACEALQNGVND